MEPPHRPANRRRNLTYLRRRRWRFIGIFIPNPEKKNTWREKRRRERKSLSKWKKIRVTPYLYTHPNRFGSLWTDLGLNRPSLCTKAQHVFCTHSAQFLFIHFLYPSWLLLHPFPAVIFISFVHFFFFSVSIAFLLLFSCIFIRLNLLFCSLYSLYIYFFVFLVT